MAEGKVYQFQFPYSSPPPIPYTAAEGVTSSSSSKQKIPLHHNSINMTAKMGWLRHVLTVLSVVIFVSDFTILFGFEASLELRYVFVAAFTLPSE